MTEGATYRNVTVDIERATFGQLRIDIHNQRDIFFAEKAYR